MAKTDKRWKSEKLEGGKVKSWDDRNIKNK
ncbi:MAG: hypothetical protein ACI945_001492 [Pseudohongiellaceae bacterium]|jgi:hypothetical protein